MALTILTVSLDDASIEAVAQRVVQLWGNPQPAPQAAPATPPAQPAAPPAAPPQPQADPWAPGAQPQPPAAPAAPAAPTTAAPTCAHGPMRYVPAGFAQSTGRAYAAFWGCPQPKGAPDKCRSVTA